jgi:hypothetical protein
MSTMQSQATRKSIKKSFPLGRVLSVGSNNPLTIHDVDDNLFACLWAVIAETMVVNGDISRYVQ